MTKRWYRITREDAQRYRDAAADRLNQLYDETRNISDANARRQIHFEEMSKFRTEWLRHFLENRDY